MSLDLDETYSVLIVRPADYSDFYAKLMDGYKNGTSNDKAMFQEKHFRVIDSVVYATDLKLHKIVSIKGKIGAEGEVPKIEVEAQLDANSTTNRKFEISSKQIIAYSYRRLCWKDGQPLKMRKDEPGPSDVGDCDVYE